MAEGGGLLNRYTPQRRIEGSNPSVSAREARPNQNQFQNHWPRQLTIAGFPRASLGGGASKTNAASATRSRLEPR